MNATRATHSFHPVRVTHPLCCFRPYDTDSSRGRIRLGRQLLGVYPSSLRAHHEGGTTCPPNHRGFLRAHGPHPGWGRLRNYQTQHSPAPGLSGLGLSRSTPGGFMVYHRARLAREDQGRRFYAQKGVSQQQTSLLR